LNDNILSPLLSSSIGFWSLSPIVIIVPANKQVGTFGVCNDDCVLWDTSNHPTIKEIINITIDTWETLVKEYYGVTKYVPSSFKILYDDFFKNPDYRKKLCDKIGGEYNEDYLNIITNAGGGSSFDKFNYQKNAQNMNPYNRYLEILDTEYKDLYLEFLKEKYNTIKLYLKYFDVNDEQKKFIQNYVR
jgi:hypothetical protein